jgi:hypothetical protein
MDCPVCKKEIDFRAGDTWVNDKGYEVIILDWGENDVWLHYVENKNKCGWEIKKFLETYTKK